ncbi:choline transporter-like protein 1 [Octopus bimaculoides]|uniref:choline transporter-like protein 1 n=1 Tax=Octopus bimaculoides TaxID=37653 RepID=UPI0022E2E628|nr:choline transporter-like protein 1 [Octopus bimaculoides]
MACCGCEDDKKKEEYVSDLSSPVHNRGCTDIFCLVVFLLFWIGMIFIAAFSFTNGDGDRLLYGYDSFGNTCGKKNMPIVNVSNSGRDMTTKTHVFFMNVANPAKSLSICVEKCPDVSMDNVAEYKKFAEKTDVHLCSYDVAVADYTSSMTGNKGPCPVVVYKSISLLNRCLPSGLKDMPKNVVSKIIDFMNESDVFEKILGDLYRSWKQMLLLGLIAVCLSFLMVILVRYIARVVIYLILIVAALGSIIGTAFLWWTYAGFKNKLDDDEAFQIPFLEIEINGEKAFLIYSIIATILTVILLLVLFIMRKRISLAIGLFTEAGKCLTDMPMLIIQPLWSVFILVIFIVYWIITLAYLSTAEIPESNDAGFVTYKEHAYVSYLWWYHVIGLIWTGEFILACEQLVISEIIATWYFTRSVLFNNCMCVCLCVCLSQQIQVLISFSLKTGKQTGQLLPNDKNHVTQYSITHDMVSPEHFGHHVFWSPVTSLGVYGLLLAYHYGLFLFIYLFCVRFKKSESEVAKFCLKCCICCLWCLEKCLKFLNANAYTVVAIKGTSFCTSARRAFNLLVNNVLRVAAINSVGDFLLFLTKICIMVLTGAIGIAWFKTDEDLHYYAIPVLLVCVFAYILASCFMSQYEMVIDTLLLCFCEDVEINDGSAEKPYYMDTSLMKFVNGASKKLNESRQTGEKEEAAEKMQAQGSEEN